jgi:hypothetical protein
MMQIKIIQIMIKQIKKAYKEIKITIKIKIEIAITIEINKIKIKIKIKIKNNNTTNNNNNKKGHCCWIVLLHSIQELIYSER